MDPIGNVRVAMPHHTHVLKAQGSRCTQLASCGGRAF